MTLVRDNYNVLCSLKLLNSKLSLKSVAMSKQKKNLCINILGPVKVLSSKTCGLVEIFLELEPLHALECLYNMFYFTQWIIWYLYVNTFCCNTYFVFKLLIVLQQNEVHNNTMFFVHNIYFSLFFKQKINLDFQLFLLTHQPAIIHWNIIIALTILNII